MTSTPDLTDIPDISSPPPGKTARREPRPYATRKRGPSDARPAGTRNGKAPEGFDWQGTHAPNGKPWEKLCGEPVRKDKRGDRNRQPGQRCQRPAGERTEHLGYGPCRAHGGNNPIMQGKVDRARDRAVVAQMLGELDPDPNLNHLDVAQEQLRRRTRAVRFLDQVVIKIAPEEVYAMRDSQEDTSQETGSGTGTTGGNTQRNTVSIRRTARENYWIDLWRKAQKDLEGCLKLCAQIRLAERQMKMIEDDAAKVADIFALTFNDPRMMLSPEVIDRLMSVAYEHLMTFAGESLPAVGVGDPVSV